MPNVACAVSRTKKASVARLLEGAGIVAIKSKKGRRIVAERWERSVRSKQSSPRTHLSLEGGGEGVAAVDPGRKAGN